MAAMDKSRPGRPPRQEDPEGPDAPAGPDGPRRDPIPGPDAARAWPNPPEPDRGFLQGRMLIAMPGIDDPRFERALVMVCLHDEEQAMGIAVNRPMEAFTVASLLDRLGMEAETAPQGPVLLGGPVERARGYVLHTDDFFSHGSTLPVAGGVAFSDTRDALEALTDAVRRPRRSIVALGYAGWGPGQLERELQAGVWLTCEPDESLLFDVDYDDKWTRALAKIGVSADRLSVESGRA